MRFVEGEAGTVFRTNELTIPEKAYISELREKLPVAEATDDKKKYKLSKIEIVTLSVVAFAVVILIALMCFGVLTMKVGSFFMMLGIIFIVGGIVFIISGRVSVSEERIPDMVPTTATVIGYRDKLVYGAVDYNPELGSPINDYFVETYPVFEVYYNGVNYYVYDKKHADNDTDRSNLPRIGSLVDGFINPEDPEECRFLYITTKKRSNKAVFGMILFIFGGLSLVLSVVTNTFADFGSARSTAETDEQGRILLTDSIVNYSFTGDTSADLNFIVYEREVVANDGRRLVFTETGGLNNGILIADDSDYKDASVGDHYYWVVKDDGETMLVDCDEYVYTGDCLPEASGLYDTDGKFILDDEYIDAEVKSSDWEIYLATIDSVEDYKVHYVDDEGVSYSLNFADTERIYYDDKAGDRFYVVRTGTDVVVFNADNYVYAER